MAVALSGPRAPRTRGRNGTRRPPEAMRSPSGLSATLVTLLVWPLSGRPTGWPVSAPHTRRHRQHPAAVAHLPRPRVGDVRQARHQHEPQAVAGLGVTRHRLHQGLHGPAGRAGLGSRCSVNAVRAVTDSARDFGVPPVLARCCWQPLEVQRSRRSDMGCLWMGAICLPTPR